MTRTGSSPIPDLMAGNHVVTARATIQIRKEDKNMLNQLMYTRALRTALLTTAVAVLAVFVSVPAVADDSKILKKSDLNTLVANAKTAQDHQRLADHFTAKAEQLEADAQEHDELAGKYKANPGIHEMKHPGSQQTASHCTMMARNLREAAKQSKELAAEHQAMAKQVK